MAKAKKPQAKPRPKAKAKPKAKPKAKAKKAPAAAGASTGAKARPEGAVARVTLTSLKPAAGSHRARRRKGRGPGSGLGKTAGRGGKGQTARSGGSTRPGFEGGQMPLIRRIPKRGFTNPFKLIAQVVNVRQLGKLAEGVEVTPDTLFGAGLVGQSDHPIKLLGTGDVDRKFVVKNVKVSASARVKIEQAGGTIEA
jgi:large subunit ribosomal protein L15